jgi:hypothetical protein
MEQKKKIGRPRKEGSVPYEKPVFIVTETKKEKKKRIYAKDKPKKVYTPEQLAEKEERQKKRIEATIANRSKAFVQPWCASALKFRNKVDEYFDTGANTVTSKINGVEVTQKIYTWAGLAYYLGFSSRDSLNTFGKKPEFKELVEKAKLVVERTYEEKLHSSNPAGGIFALKNFGWTDTTKTDMSLTINPFQKLMESATSKQKIENKTNNIIEDAKIIEDE